MVSDEELMTGYRRFGQRLEGHPTPILPWVDVATGSLGQGLPDAVGIALSGRYLERLPFRVVPAATASLPRARSGRRSTRPPTTGCPTSEPGPISPDRPSVVRRIWGGMSTTIKDVRGLWGAALVIDGTTSRHRRRMCRGGGMIGDRPTVIMAKTIKGRGFSEVEDKDGWHGKPLPHDMAERAIEELGGERHLVVRGPLPEKVRDVPSRPREGRRPRHGLPPLRRR